MTRYKIEQVPVLRDNTIVTAYNIIEVNEYGEVSELTSCEDEKSARKMSRQLNFGSGFDGWTPNFFNLKYKL